MATCETYWPEKASVSFDVKLITVIGEHLGRAPLKLPAFGDAIDFDALTTLLTADTTLRLSFAVEIPKRGMGGDGDPARTVTVILEIEPDAPVHITVTDEH